MAEEQVDVEYVSLHGYMKCMQNTNWEQTGVPDQRKRIKNHVKQDEGTRSASMTGPALAGWGN